MEDLDLEEMLIMEATWTLIFTVIEDQDSWMSWHTCYPHWTGLVSPWRLFCNTTHSPQLSPWTLNVSLKEQQRTGKLGLILFLLSSIKHLLQNEMYKINANFLFWIWLTNKLFRTIFLYYFFIGTKNKIKLSGWNVKWPEMGESKLNFKITGWNCITVLHCLSNFV